MLASLEAYDADKNTELYETLKIYTKTGFSKNRTAELMFMHRNTVTYRIQHGTAPSERPVACRRAASMSRKAAAAACACSSVTSSRPASMA